MNMAMKKNFRMNVCKIFLITLKIATLLVNKNWCGNVVMITHSVEKSFRYDIELMKMAKIIPVLLSPSTSQELNQIFKPKLHLNMDRQVGMETARSVLFRFFIGST